MLLPQADVRHNRWIFPAVFISVLVLGIAATVFTGITVNKALRVHMLDRIGTIAKALDPNEIMVLYGSEADLENPAYIHIKELLTSIRSVNHDIRFVYINGLQDGEMFFYADSEDPNSEDYSPPGESYEEASQNMFDVFETGESRFELARDRWGLWVSALAPIRDPQDGSVIALVGIDVPGEEYILNIATYCLAVFFLAVIILLLITTTQYVRRSEEKYINQKAEFLSIASHEIRTPLTGIRWAAENLLSRKDNPLDPRAKRIAELIHEGSLTLIGRINNLLNLTALESKEKLRLKRQEISLRTFVEEVISSFKLASEVRAIRLIIDDSVSSNVKIYCDLEAIRHVVANLVSNALKYTRDGTEVRVIYNDDADADKISVSDQGPGISLEDREHIFDGYHRGDQALKSGQPGTGLGLYLVKKILLVHGGSIYVESTEGKGTTFSITLPKKSS